MGPKRKKPLHDRGLVGSQESLVARARYCRWHSFARTSTFLAPDEVENTEQLAAQSGVNLPTLTTGREDDVAD
ncbi:hypothetical protein A6U89_31720 [Agrobacterium sp. B133/95]|nr:hypothetical protein A6U89_31720 [Agrobacterium sp. B133/95]